MRVLRCVFMTLDCFLIYSNQHQFSLDLLHMSLNSDVYLCHFTLQKVYEFYFISFFTFFPCRISRLLKFDYPFILDESKITKKYFPFSLHNFVTKTVIHIFYVMFSFFSRNISLKDKGVEILRAIIK